MISLDQVITILVEEDPEGLIRIGAPLSEYEPEAKTIVAALNRGVPITPAYIRDVWLVWFGCGKEPDGTLHVFGMSMRPEFERVAQQISALKGS